MPILSFTAPSFCVLRIKLALSPDILYKNKSSRCFSISGRLLSTEVSQSSGLHILENSLGYTYRDKLIQSLLWPVKSVGRCSRPSSSPAGDFQNRSWPDISSFYCLQTLNHFRGNSGANWAFISSWTPERISKKYGLMLVTLVTTHFAEYNTSRKSREDLYHLPSLLWIPFFH